MEKENKSLTFQFISCIAIERTCFQVGFIPIEADCLIMAGNISGFACNEGLEVLCEYLCRKFKHIFYVPGPLEYELGPMELGDKTCSALMEEIGAGKGNFHILGVNGNNSFVFPDHKLRLIGVRLWGTDPKIYSSRMIAKKLQNPKKNMNKGEVNELHKKDLEIISIEVSKAKERGEQVIVISHGCPSAKNSSISISDGGGEEEKEEGCELKYRLIVPISIKYLSKLNIKYWVYGAPGNHKLAKKKIKFDGGSKKTIFCINNWIATHDKFLINSGNNANNQRILTIIANK